MAEAGSTRVHVFLGVFDFGDDPAIVTDMIAVAPSAAWSRGDPLPERPSVRRTHGRWTLDSGLPPAAPIEAQLEALLGRLEPVAEGVRAVASRFRAVIWVAAYCHEVHAAFCVGPAAASRLAALGIGIDFDLYCLGPESAAQS